MFSFKVMHLKHNGFPNDPRISAHLQCIQTTTETYLQEKSGYWLYFKWWVCALGKNTFILFTAKETTCLSDLGSWKLISH